MQLSALLKGILVLGGLVFMAGSASAQFDLDVSNATNCDLDVNYKHDDGTGGCPVTYAGSVVTAGAFITIPSGMPSGSPFHVTVVEVGGVTPTIVGDCSLTTCSCSGLVSSASFTTCPPPPPAPTYTVDFYPPGTLSVNATVLVY